MKYGGTTYWSTRSKKDPRFDMEGKAAGLIWACEEIGRAIRVKAGKLECEPPDDIEIYACKD